MKRKQGFTLIELLALIVVLAIIVLIAVPTLTGVIEKARIGSAKSSALGYIAAIEQKVALGSLENKRYEDKEDYAFDEIEANIRGSEPTGGIYSLKDGKVKKGVFCINGYETNYDNNQVEVGDKCTGEDVKLTGGVKLSSTSGFYTYPISQTFEVIENISGGELSCKSSDEKVAKCEISGTKVTVEPGEKEGVATLTITSKGSSKYKEARAAYVATTENGLLSITANDYIGIYDGEEHSITVNCEGATIKYGETEGVYDRGIKPTYSEAGEYTVYYEITKSGYKTVTGSKQVKISKAEGRITLKEIAGLVEYDKEIEVEVTENKSNGEITLEVGNKDIVEASIVDNKLVIKGIQTGKTTVTLLVDETGNYNSTSVEYNVEVTKANNVLTLSSNSGNYTYPNGGTFTITENKSGGELSCTPSNKNIADCSIDGTTVTVVLGTTVGDTTLMITSAATDNYNASSAAYAVNLAAGTLSVTANNYSGAYDGASHGITVTSSGATIKYGTTRGTYNLTSSPTYTNVGTYTVYYQVSRAGYKTVEGNKTVTITPGATTVAYNSGANTCSWKNNYNITLSSSGNVGIDHYEIDWDGDGVSNGTTGSNFIPWDGFHSCTVRFRAVDTNGNKGVWTGNHHIHMDTSVPGATTVTYNSGANTCTWKNNYNLTLSASDNVGVSYYQIDVNADGIADANVSANYIPGNGHSSCTNYFRAVDHAGNVGAWSSVQHIHMDTEAPVHTNWWWGEVTKDVARLYIQTTDNIGLMNPAGTYDGHNAGVFCPTSTASGGNSNWYWFPATWDASASAYRCDITPATFGHYGETYTTHLYIYDYAGNGGYYNATSVNIPNPTLVLYDSGNQYTSITGGWTEPENNNLGVYEIIGWSASPQLFWYIYDKNDSYALDYTNTKNAIDLTGYTKLYADIQVKNWRGSDTHAVNLKLVNNSGATTGPGIMASGENTVVRQTLVWDISSITGSYKINVTSWIGPGAGIYTWVYKVWLE